MKKYIQPEITVETILGVSPLLEIATSPHDSGIGAMPAHRGTAHTSPVF